MTIKRLIQNVGDDIKISLSTGSGVLTFVNEGVRECLYISDIDSDFSKLSIFKNVDELKFIGDSKILEHVQKQSETWRNVQKNIEVFDECEVIFYTRTGKLRIPKEASSEVSSLNAATETSEIKKILIIDDSKAIQKLLKSIISGSERLEVMGIAGRPSEAQEIIDRERPDLITLDIHMPEMTGVDFLKTYLKDKGIPTIMVSSVSMNEGPLVMEALANGAISYFEKPSFEEIDKLRPKILAEINTILDSKKACINSPSLDSLRSSIRKNLKFHHSDGVVVIGSSTGGTQALEAIFTSLPAFIPPIVVAQHIPAVFSKALADRLDKLCQFTVTEATDGVELKDNTIYIAPGGRQTKLISKDHIIKISVNDDPPVNRFQPSVDYLFDSVADLKIKHVIGVILTGMGADGAKGLLNIKESGFPTIAQDKDSCVVFGMPKKAIEMGAVESVCHLNDIPERIVKIFNAFKEKKSA